MTASTDITPIVLLGAGNFAEDIADVVSGCDGFEVVGFIEGIDRSRCDAPKLGLPVHWIDDIPETLDLERCRSVCAVGTTRRAGFIEQAERLGLRFTTIIHPSALVARGVECGEGTIVGKRTIVGAGARLGRHVILNRGATIGHHVSIGDFVTVSPAANVASSVTIGERSYIGMGSNVIDQTTIGSRVVVGAGAVVVKNLPDRVLAVGVPAAVRKTGIEGY